jgi:putative tryptophan/tyrosine transport system substrate-binding protein
METSASFEARSAPSSYPTLTGGAAGAASSLWPLAASAQQPAMSRIGVVMAFKESDPVAQSLVAAFRQELQKLGWTQGRNIAIDVRYATDDRNQYAPWPWS